MFFVIAVVYLYLYIASELAFCFNYRFERADLTIELDALIFVNAILLKFVDGIK